LGIRIPFMPTVAAELPQQEPIAGIKRKLNNTLGTRAITIPNTGNRLHWSFRQQPVSKALIAGA
jgi:hypothetical protein